jgi:hypothetical protein
VHAARRAAVVPRRRRRRVDAVRAMQVSVLFSAVVHRRIIAQTRNH